MLNARTSGAHARKARTFLDGKHNRHKGGVRDEKHNMRLNDAVNSTQFSNRKLSKS